jgi:hypothetical protein
MALRLALAALHLQLPQMDHLGLILFSALLLQLVVAQAAVQIYQG